MENIQCCNAIKEKHRSKCDKEDQMEVKCAGNGSKKSNENIIKSLDNREQCNTNKIKYLNNGNECNINKINSGELLGEDKTDAVNNQNKSDEVINFSFNANNSDFSKSHFLVGKNNSSDTNYNADFGDVNMISMSNNNNDNIYIQNDAQFGDFELLNNITDVDAIYTLINEDFSDFKDTNLPHSDYAVELDSYPMLTMNNADFSDANIVLRDKESEQRDIEFSHSLSNVQFQQNATEDNNDTINTANDVDENNGDFGDSNVLSKRIKDEGMTPPNNNIHTYSKDFSKTNIIINRNITDKFDKNLILSMSNADFDTDNKEKYKVPDIDIIYSLNNVELYNIETKKDSENDLTEENYDEIDIGNNLYENNSDFECNKKTSLNEYEMSIENEEKTNDSDLNKYSEEYSDEGIIIEHGDLQGGFEKKPENCLINWEKWLKYRKKQQDYLKFKTKRKSFELVMNSEDVHEKMFRKKLIEKATNYVKFDKYRGDPKFWKTPLYLREKCTNLELNQSVLDKFDRNEPDPNLPPIIEYIGFPKIIKYNKIKDKKTFHKCNYYDERKLELEDNIDLIDIYEPDLEALYVTGKSVGENDLSTQDDMRKESIEIPKIFVENVDKNIKLQSEYLNPCIKIDSVEIDSDLMESLGKDYVITIMYEGRLDKMHKKKIVFENVGRTAIRYWWKKIEPYQNPILPLRYTTQIRRRFLFPINTNICLPGQITTINFLFKSKEPGIFHEEWLLMTDPKLSNKYKIIFSLQALVKYVRNLGELNEIEDYISEHKNKTYAREIIDDMISKIEEKFLQPQIPYKNLFSKRDIFLHNNPNHFYSYKKLEELFQLYMKIAGDDQWDYSINTLRSKILEIDSYEEKNEAIKMLYKISNSLLKLQISTDVNGEKYRCVYQLLCTFCNLIEMDAQHLRTTYRLNSSEETVSVDSKTNNKQLSKSSIKRPLSTFKQQKLNSSFEKTRRSSVRSRRSSAISVSSNTTITDLKTKSDSTILIRKTQYLNTLMIRTYQHLIDTINEITAVIECLSLINK